MMSAAAVLFFVHLGFEEVANLSEEVRDPARNLPRAIFISLALTTVLYILVALAVLALASPQELSGSAAPLALALEKAWPGLTRLLAAIALFATANTVLVTVIAASRLAFSMARDGDIPSIFGSIQSRRQTPWAAALLTFVLSAVLLPINDLKVLAELSSLAALVAFLAVNITLVILRYRLPDRPRPFRVPFAIGRMPILPIAAIGAILVLLMHFDWASYAAAAVAAGLIAAVLLFRAVLPQRGGVRRE